MIKLILAFLMVLLAPIPWIVVWIHLQIIKKRRHSLIFPFLFGAVCWVGLSYLLYINFEAIFAQRFDYFVLKILSIFILIIALLIDILTHKELGTLRIFGKTELKKTNDKLVTSGIYKYARHPRYIEHPLWFLGLGLVTGYVALLWFALYLFLALWISSYFEEKELLQRYGNAYTKYRKRTPAFFIRLWR